MLTNREISVLKKKTIKAIGDVENVLENIDNMIYHAHEKQERYPEESFNHLMQTFLQGYDKVDASFRKEEKLMEEAEKKMRKEHPEWFS